MEEEEEEGRSLRNEKEIDDTIDDEKEEQKILA